MSTKYSDMDSDSQRLPEGFERVGYDADDQTYTFRAPDGTMYQSEPGSRYGPLTPVGHSRPRDSEDSDLDLDPNVAYNSAYLDTEQLEAARKREVARKTDTREATRMMLPFALLVFVFLLLVFKLVNRPVSDNGPPQALDCDQGSHQIQIQKGDTCWAIAEEHSMGVDDLLKFNHKLDCDNLKVGEGICVPV